MHELEGTCPILTAVHMVKATMSTLATMILMMGINIMSMTGKARNLDTSRTMIPTSGTTRPTLATMPVIPTRYAGADGQIQTMTMIRTPTATAVGTPRLHGGEAQLESLIPIRLRRLIP